MPIEPKEFQSIEILQDELIELAELEDRMKAVDGRNPVQRIVDFYAVKPSLYDDPKKIKNMISELELSLKSYVKQANIKGRLLAKKSLDRYLDASEQRDISQRQLRLINQASNRQAQRRLGVSLMELQKEAGILKSDINIFKAQAKVAGFSDKDILRQLVIAGKDRNGIAQGFAKRVKQVNVAAMRRQTSASEIDQYLINAKPKEEWVWITISKNPCPDCKERAAKILPYLEWVKMGLPGMGRTICKQYCLCKVAPVSIADERFPTVREFNINSKTLVLTTASEERRLEAKKNQYKFLKNKKKTKK